MPHSTFKLQSTPPNFMTGYPNSKNKTLPKFKLREMFFMIIIDKSNSFCDMLHFTIEVENLL